MNSYFAKKRETPVIKFIWECCMFNKFLRRDEVNQPTWYEYLYMISCQHKSMIKTWKNVYSTYPPNIFDYNQPTALFGWISLTQNQVPAGHALRYVWYVCRPWISRVYGGLLSHGSTPKASILKGCFSLQTTQLLRYPHKWGLRAWGFFDESNLLMFQLL